MKTFNCFLFYQLSNAHFFQLKKEYRIENINLQFPGRSPINLGDENINYENDTDVELQIRIADINSNESNQRDLNFVSLPLKTCSVWKTIKEAKGIIKIFI